MNSITKSTSENKTRSDDNSNVEKQGTNDMNPTYDHLNYYQKLHLEGKFNVYEPIPQDNGEPLPPLAVQWKEDAKRRYRADSPKLTALDRGNDENAGHR